MKVQLLWAVVLLTGWFSREAISQTVDTPKGSVTWKEQRNWEQHYDSTPLEVATSLVTAPSVDDLVPVRISGVWINRTNFNLWRSSVGTYIAVYPDIVHGYIDESHIENIPRFKFVGDNWQTALGGQVARQQITRAFAEWSALRAEKSPVTGAGLQTGLEFREVRPTFEEPNPATEIELRYEALGTGTAANTNRILNPDGTVAITRLTFNSSNNWWFGIAGTTPADQMHFYSSALHEVGHIVGLWESNSASSVMIFRRQTGPNGPAFDQIDEYSKRVAYALYSMPIEGLVHPKFMGQ